MYQKSVVIIEEKNYINELLGLTEREQKGEVEPTVIALSSDVSQKLTASGVKFKKPEDYGLTEEYLREKGLAWFRTFPNHKVKDNKNIKELLIYNGLSLWWFVEQQLYMSGFAFPRVQDVIKQVISLDTIVKAEEPAKIYFADTDTLASKVIKSICRTRQIATVAISHSSIIKKIRRFLVQRLRAIAYVYG